MKTDWLPFSAALLLTGALALALGTILLPSSDSTTDTLHIVEDQGGVWLCVAAIYFLAAVCLTLGLPSILTLFDQRGRVLALVSAVVLEFGFIGTAGYAMLMVFFRALVRTNTIVDKGLDDIANDAGLRIFLYGWIAGFFLGELLLAIALLRARTVPRWVPLVLGLHVATIFVSGVLPAWAGKATIMLFVAGIAGVAIHSTAPGARRRYS
ncbi:hypothetical protein [Nocardioides conyzicola]|uniref:Uncharacterized protein n=1 Tax=Nocardioides conyzicola TaxID=1651781 RepID=A0ABP8XI99_9ACTN